MLKESGKLCHIDTMLQTAFYDISIYTRLNMTLYILWPMICN